MEHLCEAYPNESILFLKRAICTTIVSGLILTTPIIICSWNSLNDHEADRTFKLWSLFRILLFFIQLPLRCGVWKKLNKCSINESKKINMLINILRSKTWKCTQIINTIVSMWVVITLILTRSNEINIVGDVARYYFCIEGYLSPCLWRWSLISIGIFLTHIVFIIKWLKNVMLIKQGNEKLAKDKYSIIENITLIDRINCSICIDTCAAGGHYQQNKFVQLNECRHNFHQICIEQWFKTKKFIQCPLCNKNYGPLYSNDSLQTLRNRKYTYSLTESLETTTQAIDVLLQSPIYFMPN